MTVYFSVRLVGPTPNIGRVEVFADGEWGTVCDDGFDMNDANVTCNQLGFNGALLFGPEARFGAGTGRVLLDDLHCTGDEASILKCERHSGVGESNCNHGEDVGVICTSPGEWNNARWVKI